MHLSMFLANMFFQEQGQPLPWLENFCVLISFMLIALTYVKNHSRDGDQCLEKPVLLRTKGI